MLKQQIVTDTIVMSESENRVERSIHSGEITHRIRISNDERFLSKELLVVGEDHVVAAVAIAVGFGDIQFERIVSQIVGVRIGGDVTPVGYVRHITPQ